MDYKNTLNLPQTDFPMKASLPQREPLQVEKWKSTQTYRQMVFKRKDSSPFIFHDGPPYANGNIHIGHALNKILKDILVKYKNLQGARTEFIPGWDCHGLPIELGVERQLAEEKIEKHSLSKVDFRKKCEAFARTHIENQKKQFQRLGVLADWENPYLTMSPSYVASIIRELGTIAETGALYKGNKPVYWCMHCRTALADAEIEYQEHRSPSVYVKFYFDESDAQKLSKLTRTNLSHQKVAMVIWTTTPWTLPANVALSVHPEFEYGLYSVDGEVWIIAKALQEAFFKVVGKTGKELTVLNGKNLEGFQAIHPFIDRHSLVITGTHVTQEAGTGVVHTAPGHGIDDYKAGLQNKLEILAPVDARGHFTDAVPQWKDLFIFKANPLIIEHLQRSNHLIFTQTLQHSYPHCWRCHQPVIYRATPQWFIGMEQTHLRHRALEAIQKVKWVPKWGINRILSMVENRPDWCISRQRTWGVPIPIFYCDDCNEPLYSKESFDHIASLIEKNNAHIWHEWEVEKLLKPGIQCKCHNLDFKKIRKETDILDVWFDSGVSHAAVLDPQQNQKSWPADLYLEGSDQHRGWFQTSLLTAMATRGKAPFKQVLTHGFVNDKEGKKMSKSKGNVTNPMEFCNQYGAEILRLWVVLEDYRNDVNFSMETIDRISESYRKIRNTFRYILGNLADFNPKQNKFRDEDYCDLDQWALYKTQLFLEKLQLAYDSYEFHLAYHALVNFCVNDLSALYFDILKDRLYTLPKQSKERLSSQSALHQIAETLVLALAPILSFTAEEVWGYLKKDASVFNSSFPKLAPNKVRTEKALLMESFFENIRVPVNKALEQARAQKEIGLSLDAKISFPSEMAGSQYTHYKGLNEDLAGLLKVSQFTWVTHGSEVQVQKADGQKCTRCWRYAYEVGEDASHPNLCERCVMALAH